MKTILAIIAATLLALLYCVTVNSYNTSLLRDDIDKQGQALAPQIANSQLLKIITIKQLEIDKLRQERDLAQQDADMLRMYLAEIEARIEQNKWLDKKQLHKLTF